jgi:hypothetical protein
MTCKLCSLHTVCQKIHNPPLACLPSLTVPRKVIWGLRGTREIQRQDERVMSGVIDGESRDEY